VPGTTLERLLTALGVVAAVGLGVLTFRAWQDYRDSAPAPASAPASLTPVAATQPTTTAEGVAGAEFGKSASSGQGRATATPRLVLAATRGDSWVEVRSGSATGQSLYANTLAQGQRISYRRTRLWIRFGLPANVDATIDGARAQLPAGVATVMLHNGRLTTIQTG